MKDYEIINESYVVVVEPDNDDCLHTTTFSDGFTAHCPTCGMNIQKLSGYIMAGYNPDPTHRIIKL